MILIGFFIYHNYFPNARLNEILSILDQEHGNGEVPGAMAWAHLFPIQEHHANPTSAIILATLDAEVRSTANRFSALPTDNFRLAPLTVSEISMHWMSIFPIVPILCSRTSCDIYSSSKESWKRPADHPAETSSLTCQRQLPVRCPSSDPVLWRCIDEVV